MRDRDIAPAVLPDSESRSILTRVILPTATEGAARQQRPVVIFVAGQPGAGKSHLADLLHSVLDHRGGAVRIGSDLYKICHPAYEALLTADDRSAGVQVRYDTLKWQVAVEQHTRRNAFDAVVETALACPSQFREAAAAYRGAGYHVDVAVLATPEALSQLGVLERYLLQVRASGTGRYVPWDNHDSVASRLMETLQVIEVEKLADRVLVLRRGLELLYSNRLVNGVWSGPLEAARAVHAERARPWTAKETARFRMQLSRTEHHLHHERVSSERRLAAVQVMERAFALSEQVRRTAQAIPDPPGVDYHRLSASEHRWIFEAVIVPSYLQGITVQEEPIATFVLGQPGAGKWRAANTVKRALSGRGVIRLSGDDFKSLHPDYHQLLIKNPRGAGATIRSDYKAWMAQAEAYVRERRGDVLIEAAPGSAMEFLERADLFAEAGYRIELVVLAVREADSRQGTAHRYALVQRSGMPARFTTRSGHDLCYQALGDVMRGAEAHPAVASLRVLRRDFTALYSNVRRADGCWASPERAALALTLERRRLYTLPEATHFVRVHQELVAALPQYRGELEDIADLARPLLPEPMRPRPLLPGECCEALLPLPVTVRTTSS